MTQQDPLAILRQFSPQASQVTQQLGAGQQVAGNRLALQQQEALNPLLLQQQELANRQQQVQTRGLESQENVQNTVNRLQELERQIGFGATPQQLAGTLQGFIQDSTSRGGNPADSVQALEALQAGGVEGLQGLLGQAKQVFQQQGLIKAPVKAGGIDFAKIDPAKFTQASVAQAEQSGRYSDLVPIEGEVKPPAFLGELRKELRSEASGLQKQAGVLVSNFTKLKNLTTEIKAGNRTAVAQALVSLVKLGDPTSVVKDSEMEAALNAENPLAAATSLLQARGASDETQNILGSLLRKIDPLNPTTVNTEELLSTANAMLSPNIDTIAGAYDIAKGRAAEQLDEGGVKSIFSKSRDELFTKLRDISPATVAPVSQPPTELRNQPQDVQTVAPITAIDANGNIITVVNGQWVDAQGNPVQ